MKLILFDIDGTVMDSGGAGTLSLDLAFEELFSVRHAFKEISMAGKTDIQILKEGLTKHGLGHEDSSISTLCASYIRHLRVQIENPKKQLKPGITESLEMLHARADVRLGLLTGNIEAGARIKLGSFDLNRYFPAGAFGNDDEDRNRLLPIAVERFSRLGINGISYTDCIVIGDTPRDVECAKMHGAYAIAVATGPYAYESLAASGADRVLRNMHEFDYPSVI